MTRRKGTTETRVFVFGLAGRGWVAVVSPTTQAKIVVEDRLIHGLTASENEANVTLAAGLNLLVVKTTTTFSGDAVAIEGARSLMFGMEARDVPRGMGVLRRTNEWSVALALEGCEHSAQSRAVGASSSPLSVNGL